ncbi:MAG: YaaC family protein [Desulfobaccales bacterium]
MSLPNPREGKSFKFHVYPGVSEQLTIGDPEAIIWSSIRHLCSRGVVHQMVASVHGITRKRDMESVSKNLKLYIQQAYEFYEVARIAKPNTAPLIYYYSFLNLAKALCEIKSPRFHDRPECYRHGVSWRPNRLYLINPERDEILITLRGVWHVLWESLMRNSCTAVNPTRLRIKNLFSYCAEVSVEYEQAFGVEDSLINLENPEILYDETSTEAWLKFSINRSILMYFRLSGPAFISHILMPRSNYKEVRSNNRELRTFESSKAKKFEPKGDIISSLHNDILELNVFTHLGPGKELRYSLPDQRRLPMRIPQILVMYSILFWLGSIVRYDPHSVNALMDSKYWSLIDGFMSQSRLWLLEQFEWAFYQAETTLCLAR